MAEDFEAVYTHPGGATAIFTRRHGSLDAVARGLDSEQFWVFKNVKALLVRNDEGDLEEASRLMARAGFTVRVSTPEPVAVATAAAGAVAVAPAYPVEHGEAHAAAHPHAPAPSYWPIMTGLAVAIGVGGLMFVNTLPFIAIIGAVLLFVTVVGWGLEPFEA
jgi:hypothetical protein